MNNSNKGPPIKGKNGARANGDGSAMSPGVDNKLNKRNSDNSSSAAHARYHPSDQR